MKIIIRDENEFFYDLVELLLKYENTLDSEIISESESIEKVEEIASEILDTLEERKLIVF